MEKGVDIIDQYGVGVRCQGLEGRVGLESLCQVRLLSGLGS